MITERLADLTEKQASALQEHLTAAERMQLFSMSTSAWKEFVATTDGYPETLFASIAKDVAAAELLRQRSRSPQDRFREAHEDVCASVAVTAAVIAGVVDQTHAWQSGQSAIVAGVVAYILARQAVFAYSKLFVPSVGSEATHSSSAPEPDTRSELQPTRPSVKTDATGHRLQP